MTRHSLTHVLSALALVSLVAFAPACDKEKGANASTGSSSASANKSASSKKKLPKKGSGTAKAKAKKGGSGDSKPSNSSKKAASATTGAKDKKKVEGDNPCDDAPDGAAECHGSSIYFCADKELYELDCDGLMTAAHPDLFTAGSCYESDDVTDCLGVGVSEDDAVVACTSDLSLCCDEDGGCYAQ
jgi:hypothetical protein